MMLGMKRSTGFTLIELMVTVAVAAILMGVAVPAMHSMIQNNRVTSAANSLIGAYNLARSEAIKLGGNGGTGAALCPSADSATCSLSWAAALGWIVFVDANADGIPDVNGIVHSWAFSPSGMSFPGAPLLVRFQSDGAVDPVSVGGLANLPLTFDVKIPNCTGKGAMGRMRRINIAVTGRLSVQKLDCP